MSGRICTRYRDDDGLDVGCHLLSKEYMIENYPSLVDQAKVPGLWLWGSGGGRLGNNAITRQSSPIQTISGGTNWRSVSADPVQGSLFAVGHNTAIKTDGSLWLWGAGGYGQLGNNSIASQSSPIQTISGGTSWRMVSAGDSHTSAIKTDGTLWVWGCGGLGRLGNNAITNQSSPIQTISGGTNWRTVSAGNGHTGAIKTDGSLWLWGVGDSGRLGNNAITRQSSPIQTISGGTNWRTVNVSTLHTAAIKTDGSLWLWGDGGLGRLGNNEITSQSSPIQTISGGTNWRTVSAGNGHTAAIKTDGTLWLWGVGCFGRLGNNEITSQSSPIQTISGGTNWRTVSAGNGHTAAIKTDGSLWVWGYGGIGQLGNNEITSQSSPIQTISGGTSWRMVSAGNGHTAAIKDLGDF
jgi:alpha-tubulin suppressor-like RCC1 family protein